MPDIPQAFCKKLKNIKFKKSNSTLQKRTATMAEVLNFYQTRESVQN
jgi:hypothetical protein